MIKTEFMNLLEELDQITEAAQKTYKITYREDGVSKSFTVKAGSKAEAEQIAWSSVDAESVWVTELEESLNEDTATLEEVYVVNYVEYKHSYCHFLAPYLKKLNYLCNVVKAPIDKIKDYIRNILNTPECRVTKKEQLFLAEIYQHVNSYELYQQIKNSINKAYETLVYVDANGELVANPTAEQVRDCMARTAAMHNKPKKDAVAEKQIQRAQQAFADGKVDEYNYSFRHQIRQDEQCPAVDPVSGELVYDIAKKETILKQTEATYAERRRAAAAYAAKVRAEKSAEAKADKKITYVWTASYVINNRTFSIRSTIVGNNNPDDSAEQVTQKALKRIQQEEHECLVFKEPFSWDGKLTITYKDPTGKEELYKVIDTKKLEAPETSSFNEAIDELNKLYESRSIIHDVDVLYHFTNPTPFLKIFSTDTLRADVNLKAVCLTTDRNYRIYGYPCGIQFSRKKLLNDGYEIIPFDELADDPDGTGESDERIHKMLLKSPQRKAHKDLESVTQYMMNMVMRMSPMI